MIIKRFEGNHVHDVIDQVRRELGPEAVVLHTRWRTANGLKRLLGRPQVEVWAGTQTGTDSAPAAAVEAVTAPLDPPHVRALALRQELNLAAPARGAQSALAPVFELPEREPEPEAEMYLDEELSDAGPDDLTVQLLSEFNSVLERIEGKVDRLGASARRTTASPREQALIDLGVEPEVAAGVLSAARDRSVADALHEVFLKADGGARHADPRVIVLVGPSGAGKTSTLAKLAGHWALARGKKVALVSTDTQRIGAFAQLQALGDLMQLPVHGALSAADAVAKVRAAQREADLVLIDTPAVSGPGAAWDQLLDALIAIEPDELQLVLAATTKPADVNRLTQHFGAGLPLAGVIVTKLDESADAGLLINLAWRYRLPLTWLGTGPDIPGDLTVATPTSLVARAWTHRITADSPEQTR